MSLGESSGGTWRPTVLVHGLLSSATHDDGLIGRLGSWVREAMPGVYVKTVTVTGSRMRRLLIQELRSVAPESTKEVRHRLGQAASLVVPLDDQVEELCDQLRRDPALSRGFNVLAHSQGALVARGFVERCNTPPVYNFVSLAGPQARANALLSCPGWLPSCTPHSLLSRALASARRASSACPTTRPRSRSRCARPR